MHVYLLPIYMPVVFSPVYADQRKVERMFPAQIPVIMPDDFSRCEEQMQKTDHGMIPRSIQKTDVSLKGIVERAIRDDRVLRAIEYSEIDVFVNNGIIYLNGHITNTASQKRIENVIRSIPSILGLRNRLILDDKLILEVAASLGTLEHIYGCKFFTGGSHGVISLGGIVSDENVKLLAEKRAASHPNVRGVINHISVAGVESESPDQPFLQPTIGELIYFLDGVSGVVKQVIINPNNRRVTGMIVWGRFADQRSQELKSSNLGGTRSSERLVVLPMDVIRYLTKDSGFLHIKGSERERYMDFDPASYFPPTVDWTPPYPYCPQDVLFRPQSKPEENQTSQHLPRVPFMAAPQEELLWEQLLANESLGG
jgi:osmotically-inducible protein OsmY